MSAAPDPYGSGHHPVLASIASRSFFLSGQLLLGNLSKTVVVVGNAPHDRPGFLVGHLIGNRASFLCTKAPMIRIPNEVSGHQLTSTSVPMDGKAPAIDGQGTAAPPSRVIPVSLLTEHDSFIHFDERPLGHRLRQSVPLQYPIIDPHQHFELCERCLPKVLV